MAFAGVSRARVAALAVLALVLAAITISSVGREEGELISLDDKVTTAPSPPPAGGATNADTIITYNKTNGPIPDWEKLHTPESVQTRSYAPYAEPFWSAAHANIAKIAKKKLPSSKRYPRARDLTLKQLHEAFKKEYGLRTLIGRYEEMIMLHRTGNSTIANIAMGVPRTTEKCAARHHHVSESRRRWNNGIFVNFTTSLAARLRPVSEVEVGGLKLCVQPEDLSESFTPQPFSDYINAAKLPLMPSAESKKTFGYSFFPLYDGFAIKMLADFQYETDSWLFGLQHPDLFGFLKQRWFDHPLIYWHLEGKDLQTLKEHIHKFPGPFFLISASLDDPDFPSWLLENENVLRIFCVNVPAGLQHPKIVVLPFGQRYTLGIETNEKRTRASQIQPTKLMLASFTIGARGIGYSINKRTIRREAMMIELKKNWPGLSEHEIHRKMTEDEYTENLLQHKFILSPPGIGIDAYRTWQVLNVGRVPVVKVLLPPELYDNLPVVSVREWSDLTQDKLERAWEEMKGMYFNLQKLYYPYWVRHIIRECLAVQS